MQPSGSFSQPSFVIFHNSNLKESPTPLPPISPSSSFSSPLHHHHSSLYPLFFFFFLSFLVKLSTSSAMVETDKASIFPNKLLCFLPLLALLLFLANGVESNFQDNNNKKILVSLHDLHWKLHENRSGHTHHHHHHHCLFQKSRKEKGATILEMKHKDSCSGKKFDWNEKMQERLILDKLQHHSLQSRIKNLNSAGGNVNVIDSLDTEIPLTSGLRLETLNYIVTVELGGKKMTVIVDTGSDLTWVQCLPCKLCYNQQDPIFNPSASSSYRTILCNSSTCQSLQFATGNSGVCGNNPQTCNYVVAYGDGSYTLGELGFDQLNLGTTPVTKFIFGCGRNNKGLFGGASGLMGLGRSDLSLISQTSEIFQGVFSYCLPITDTDASGSLVLGGNTSVYKNTTPISYTRMLVNPSMPTFYFLNLTGMSVGGVSLQSPSFGNGRILIDSGTVISRLPPSIYRALKAEFLKQFSQVPSAPPFLILDTCFNLSSFQEVEIPTMKMYFEGNAELTVDLTGIFYFAKTDASQVCLAVASLADEEETGIVGNYQQRNQRVIYDTKEFKLGFAGEACSFN